jgi:hypothetical protein
MVNKTSSHWVTIGSRSLLGLQNTWLARPKRLLRNLPKVAVARLEVGLFVEVQFHEREVRRVWTVGFILYSTDVYQPTA